MTPTEILEHSPVCLSQEDRRFFFEHGYLLLDGYLRDPWLARLRGVYAGKIEESRTVLHSDDQFDVAPDHSAAHPRLRRLKKAVDQHPALWEFASESPLVDVAADLVGPSVKFHSSKLNYKWSGGGEAVKWHQDIQAWPHTNFSPVTLGVYLEDTGPALGPLAVIPGSHRGPLYEQYHPDGRWSGALGERDLVHAGIEDAVELCGQAGTVIAIHCRAIHGSRENRSDQIRPMLLCVYSSADAFPICAAPAPTSHTGDIVRGEPARWPHLEPLDLVMPPRWDQVGYGSIFTAQGGEE